MIARLKSWKHKSARAELIKHLVETGRLPSTIRGWEMSDAVGRDKALITKMLSWARFEKLHQEFGEQVLLATKVPPGIYGKSDDCPDPVVDMDLLLSKDSDGEGDSSE